MTASPAFQIATCSRREAERILSSPAELLNRFSEEEAVEITGLGQRRRLDRVGGRVAAKNALREHFSTVCGWSPAERQLEIFNAPDGRPLLRLPAGAPAQAPSFSISHCSHGAAAAVASPGRHVGVDMETIAPRPLSVLAFVSTDEERTAAESWDVEAQTKLWTGKEAVLKLFGLGLNADARNVRPQGETAALSGLPGQAWRRLGSPRVRLAYQRRSDVMLAVAYTGD
ncbi:MAG: 4'-phosphopantetheinyl transferase superfamily protein [Elusimicrobiota bacterium]